ncbi:maturin isoform X3 [Lagenorhynchus albirostris]|uniref:maturin isoform X3 n=1 Tax=Lagenorhynchus albirostris TaxID=27610 RepID=UPI0028F12C7F|nr:maturin isoform X3 [Lagenorhynchus albirostris]
MDFQQLADVAEKWCSNTPFELIATEETERRMDFYADPGVSFYVLCPDNGCGDNFLLGLPDADDDAFEEYSADVEEEEPEADHPQMGACWCKPDYLNIFCLTDWCREEYSCSW